MNLGLSLIAIGLLMTGASFAGLLLGYVLARDEGRPQPIDPLREPSARELRRILQRMADEANNN